MLPYFRFQRLVPISILLVVCFYFLQGSSLRDTILNGSTVSSPKDATGGQPQKPPLHPAVNPVSADTPEPPKKPDIDRPTDDSAAPKAAVNPTICDPEIERLRGLGLSKEVLYHRRCIKPKHRPDASRDAVTKFPDPLFESGVQIDFGTCLHDDIPTCKPFDLTVPPTDPHKKYPHLLFGVSTLYKRLEESLPAFATWLTGSDSLMVAVVVDAEPEKEPPKDFSVMEALYRDAGIKLKCVKTRNSSLSVDQNHFTVIEDLVEAVTPETKWIGLLDDDTFFPSLYNMDQELAKHDHSKPAWIGALSEDLAAIRNWGIMAFGGAGVFLSVPLAKELTPRISDCIDNAERNTGDAILRDCIFTETHTKLTTVAGMYQHDIRGDVSGFYESGVRPLSLHHWKSWYHAPVDKMAAVVKVCGDCFLQRWQFGDDTLFANGYSITQYPQLEGGLEVLDLQRMEMTWAAERKDFDWSLGPLRDKLPAGEKKSFILKEVYVSKAGALHQFYVYKADAALLEKDEIVEIVWEP